MKNFINKLILDFLYYSGLNFQDLMVRLGAIDSPPKTPCILGFECAGEVEAVGEDVEDFKVSSQTRIPRFEAKFPIFLFIIGWRSRCCIARVQSLGRISCCTNEICI